MNIFQSRAEKPWRFVLTGQGSGEEHPDTDPVSDHILDMYISGHDHPFHSIVDKVSEIKDSEELFLIVEASPFYRIPELGEVLRSFAFTAEIPQTVRQRYRGLIVFEIDEQSHIFKAAMPLSMNFAAQLFEETEGDPGDWFENFKRKLQLKEEAKNCIFKTRKEV